MGFCLSGSPLYPQIQSYHKVGAQELFVDYSYCSKCLTHSRSKTLKYFNSKIMVGKRQGNNMGLNCMGPLTCRFPSINIINVSIVSSLWFFLKTFFFSSLLCSNNTVYNVYTKYVYVVMKASNQQESPSS